MTLLSIREQEAVQRETPTKHAGLGGDYHYITPRQLKARDKTLILATRDAIARQVREQAQRMGVLRVGYPNRFEEAATFIEGLDV